MTYIVLFKFTQKGLMEVTQSPDRHSFVVAMLERHKVVMREFYLTFGEWDFVAIIEAPNHESLAAVLLEINRMGAVRSTTMTAIPEDRYKELVANLSDGSE